MRIKNIRMGYVHIYTGSGKGKTTASMGLAVRAASRGLKVCMFQFLKKRGSAIENNLKFNNFKVFCLDQIHPGFAATKHADRESQKRLVSRKILRDIKKVKNIIKRNRYNVIILDEIINCVDGRFIDEEVVLDLIKIKPRAQELVLTGRGASKGLIEKADYVTRLDKIKHPYDKGIYARSGIEY